MFSASIISKETIPFLNAYEISSQEVNSNKEKARSFLYGLGGAENIDSVSNCATRLRVNVKDSSLVEDTPFFQNAGALGLVKKKNAVQVIVGLSLPNVREEFELLLDEDLQDSKKMI